ncbi:acyltransferase domain-containing protein [Bifidobacterium biavatii]|uniref:Uncharacterized protein n=1 Tax=Bifidobacterium biavatii DSM 23969 TaxID=1437608 RepID=A0A087A4M3_9BIFI|nr:acyltransferase domain-containing protein [Bifidobacterium biavatii]KFI53723.1 hypothetical protein BBIA_1321 [Bifidobacterium biavatii DSM 23969]
MTGNERDIVAGVARRIALPQPVFDDVLQIDDDLSALEPHVQNMTDPKIRRSAWTTLRQMIGSDPHGWKMLRAMLYAAGAYTLPVYRQRGITDDVFDATMACFSRFVGEHRVSYGEYGFDRDFWTIRQLSGRLYRLGQLEFEIADRQDSPTGALRSVCIHIPSDALLTPEYCDESFDLARKFIGRHFPEWENAPYECESWLLSPTLPMLLPADSNILKFQRRFVLVGTDMDAPDWREWVYQRSDKPVAELPERTSLQRAMKRHLMQGGKVGVGTGRLVTA